MTNPVPSRQHRVVLIIDIPIGGAFASQPANPNMLPIYTNPDNVDIQGKVICVIRQLD